MSFQSLVQNELESLKTLRDELKVRAHLFRADVRDEWAVVEKRLDIIESELNRFGNDAKGPASDVGDAVNKLVAEGKEMIDRIRQRSRMA